LIIKGTNDPGVQSFDSTNITEPGASGQAGGGKGGAGNWVTTESTPYGGSGYGAYQIPRWGGEGGETGYAPFDENARRGAGGGGGSFGPDVLYTATTPTPVHPCPDQSSIGLDAED